MPEKDTNDDEPKKLDALLPDAVEGIKDGGNEDEERSHDVQRDQFEGDLLDIMQRRKALKEAAAAGHVVEPQQLSEPEEQARADLEEFNRQKPPQDVQTDT